MDGEDRAVVEADIFNGIGISLDASFDRIRDQEDARQIMGRIRRYIEARKSGKETREAMKAEAKDICDLIERKAFPEE